MKTKKLLSISFVLLLMLMAYSTYNISLSNFRLTDKNYSYIAGLKWYHSADGLSKAFQIAAKENKPIVVYFWAVWCQYCAKFQANTLGNPQINKILENDYVLVAMDLDVDRDIANKYGVGYPPYNLFLDKDNNILDRIPGAVDPDTYLPIITKVRDVVKNGSKK